MASSKDSEKQMMDVAKPGKTTPDATSKPIIVGHKPMMKDPMVTPEEPTDKPKPAEEKPQTVRPSKVITPPTPAPDAPDTQVKKTEEQPADAATPTVSDDAAVLEAVAEQAESNKKNGGVSEEEKKHQAEIAKLIADKTYFVPVSQTSRKRKSQLTTVLSLLLLVIVGGVLAIDAGMVDVGISLPFDLIK